MDQRGYYKLRIQLLLLDLNQLHFLVWHMMKR